MAYRDRTALFLRYRTEARALHGSRSADSRFDKPALHSSSAPLPSKVLTAGSGEELRHDEHAGETSRLHNALTADVEAARAALAELREGYATHLLPRFGDVATGALEARVRAQAHALTARLHAAEGRVRALATGGGGGGATDVRRNMQRRFAGELQEISAEFRARQKEYLESLRRQRDVLGENAAANGGFAIADDRDEAAFAEMDDVVEGDAVHLLQAERVDMSAAEREAELKAVAENISDLAMLVKDLAGLVVDQGTLLDRIDYNLEDVEETTVGAVRELRTAERYQRKRHGVCCIVILATACAVMMILLILRWTA